jgi:HSP20 family molecular chaperone IbpA
MVMSKKKNLNFNFDPEDPSELNKLFNELLKSALGNIADNVNNGEKEPLVLNIKIEKMDPTIVKKDNNTTPVQKGPIFQNNTQDNDPVPNLISNTYENNEPLFDVLRRDEGVSIITDLKSIDKSDINITVNADQVYIDVDTTDVVLHKVVDMPFLVSPDKIKSSYKNGILELNVKRSNRKNPIRANIVI